MAIVPMSGLYEAHLTVADLDHSIALYRDVLGLPIAYAVPSRHAAFFWIGAPGAAMLGLWSVHSLPMSMRMHIAFRVTLPQLEASVEALRAAGLTLRNSGRGPAIEEPVVLTWMPRGQCLFRRSGWPHAEIHLHVTRSPPPPQSRSGSAVKLENDEQAADIASCRIRKKQVQSITISNEIFILSHTT